MTVYTPELFAAELMSFQRKYGHAIAVAAPQGSVRGEFAKLGIPTFAREREAMDALAQLADHADSLKRL